AASHSGETLQEAGTLATGKIPVYNSGWHLIDPGTQYYSLVSNGTSSLPTYQQVNLTQGVTNTLPILNGGTGQTTAQTAIDALLPSQTSNSGKFITTDGTNSSWGVVPTVSISILSNNISVTNGTDVYTCPGCAATNATQTKSTMVFSKAGTIKNLYAHRTTTTNSVVVTAWKNTSSQTLTATIIN
ncbi:MAG: hypothetical protein V4440_03845, partial [Pseudomonadota bacterium]